MNQYANLARSLKTPETMEQLIHLYGNRDGVVLGQVSRYTTLLKRHEEYFNPQGEIKMISAPGRTEIGGNHTDHNRGRVLAAAVNLDTLAAVSKRDDMIVNLHSEGYKPIQVNLMNLDPSDAEKGTTSSLIRGVASRMKELGYRIGGFDAAVTSNVASGSGLSSSAAFEVLIVAILDELYNGSVVEFKERAKISQYAENVFFGKPSGLLDQMASSAGGLVTIDFKPDEPIVRPMNYNFAEKGYALVVVATGGSHADLTDDYAAIPAEMKAVAAHFGENNLRRVRSEEFLAAIPELRKEVSDRAIMRAMHFYQENKRVQKQVESLEEDNLNAFFQEIIASGRSSFMYLQNVYAKPSDQSLSLALALAERTLKDKGAWRIHGGGFAGTTLNFVPVADMPAFINMMEGAFGARCCHVLDIRPVGPYTMKL